MTTIQKFEESLTTTDGKLDVLSDSGNVFIMVDEAHRTQYGVLGSLRSRALPNAVMIGFTGTPIDKGFGRSTMKRFGPLIDSYTIPQSVEDGATVPIWYEARLPELAIEGPTTLDNLFDAMFGEQSDGVREEIRRRYANRETVAEAERRIEMIALDIAQHFNDKVRPNGFKAQIVAPSRAAALRYTEQLKSFGLSAYPIITTSHNDGPEFQVARELDHELITSNFVDLDGEPEVQVVVDMLITGFDAPVEQVLYLDRPLREHGLLQAIARVNHRFSHQKDGAETEKTHGLAVDYCGISHDLEQALSSFDWPDVQDTMQVMEEDPATVIEAAAIRAESHFKGLELSDTWACVMVFAPDANTEGNYKADLFERFNADYRQFSRLMDRLLPDQRALPYVDRLARLTLIRSYTRAHFLREDAEVNWTDIGAKVKQLIDQRISAEVRQMMQPVSILDEDFEEKVAHLPHAEARASVMEHAIRAQIHEGLEQNPVFYERLSQRLARIIEQMRTQVIDAAEAYRQMAGLQREVHGEANVAARHGLSPMSLAIYEILRGPSGEDEEERHARQDAGSYMIDVDAGMRDVALSVEGVLTGHGSFGQVVETLPPGFSYMSSSRPDGAVTVEGREVSFVLFGETDFTYTVTASSTAGYYSFFGILTNSNGEKVPVGGAFRMTVESPPSVNVSYAAGSEAHLLRLNSPISLEGTFGESVSGLALEDIGVANGIAGNFAGSGAAYTFDVTPNTIGEMTVDIAAGVATDSDGNGNMAAYLSLGITYDDDGAIGKPEAITAIRDYFRGTITKAQTIAVIRLYFST